MRLTKDEAARILWSFATADGRDALFGGADIPAAFIEGSMGDVLPNLMAESPLTGEPRTDLHAAYWRLDGPGPWDARICEWFRNEGRGVVGATFKAPFDGIEGYYLRCDGDTDLANRFLFAARAPHWADIDLPEGWRADYVGYLPGREGGPVRIGSFLGGRYRDAETVKADFGSLGCRVTDGMAGLCAELASTGLPADVQIDVADGRVTDEAGFGLAFDGVTYGGFAEFFDTGPGAEAMRILERHGLADSRWKLIAGCSCRDEFYDRSVTLSAMPGNVKVKFKDGEPVEAKTYVSLVAFDDRSI